MWPATITHSPSLGSIAVFISVLITQLGAPIPAAPTLILAGTMAAIGQGSYLGAFAIGPVSLDAIMVDRDVAGHMDGKFLNRVGLQLHALGGVRGDPISDMIFPDGC